jgi:hypothetical protein
MVHGSRRYLIEIAFDRIPTLKTVMLLLQAQSSFNAIVHPVMERLRTALDRVLAFTQRECRPRPTASFIGC